MNTIPEMPVPQMPVEPLPNATGPTFRMPKEQQKQSNSLQDARQSALHLELMALVHSKATYHKTSLILLTLHRIPIQPILPIRLIQ